MKPSATASASALATALLTLVSILFPPTGHTAPIVPGAVVEPYATAAWPAWMSLDEASGVLYTGVETGPPARIWRIASGGAPVAGYGAVPILDPDAVLHDGAGWMSGGAGAVLVGGRGSGGPELWAILPDAAETVVSVFGPPSDWTNLSDMEFDTGGRLLFGEENGQSGRVFVSSAPGDLPAELFQVSGRVAGLEVDAEDRIYTSTFDGRVRVHAADGSVLHDPLLSGLGNRILPIGIGQGGAWGTDLYTVNQHTGQLIRADLSGQITVVGTGFDGILGDFEFGPDHALYVSDLALGLVWRIAFDGTAGIPAAEASASQVGLRILHENPVRPPARVGYAIPASGEVRLRVYDIHGRWVRTLDHRQAVAGTHTAAWDGRDAAGRQAPAGTYFYRLDAHLGANLDTRTSKVLLLR